MLSSYQIADVITCFPPHQQHGGNKLDYATGAVWIVWLKYRKRSTRWKIMCGELITHTFWVLLQTPVLSPPLKSSSSSVWHLSMRLSLPAPFESTQRAREMTRAVTSSVASHGERQWIQWTVAMCRQTRGQSPGSWLTQPQPGLSRQLGSL